MGADARSVALRILQELIEGLLIGRVSLPRPEVPYMPSAMNIGRLRLRRVEHGVVDADRKGTVDSRGLRIRVPRSPLDPGALYRGLG